MQLTLEQESAFSKMQAWMRNDEKRFILQGYAGVGKSTLLSYWIAHQSSEVVCCTPTAKAGLVLHRKLKDAKIHNIPVCTVHSLLYLPRDKSAGRLPLLRVAMATLNKEEFPEEWARLESELVAERQRVNKQKIGFNLKEELTVHDVLIVDEASMVTPRMAKDLENSCRKIMYIGDPHQLPPVMSEDWFGQQEPDVMLTTVQRQATDNPIIRLSMKIRYGQPLSASDFTDGCRRISARDVGTDEYMEPDTQVIIGTNAGRQQMNRYFREVKHGKQLSRAYLLVPGDRLICKTNLTRLDASVVNGSLWNYVGQEYAGRLRYDRVDPVDHGGKSVVLNTKDPVNKNSESVMVASDEPVIHLYLETAVELLLKHYHRDVNLISDDLEMTPFVRRQLDIVAMDYGYAITVHSSQGSEWDNVILCDDWQQADKARWLYTAVTRAKKRLLWVQK